MASIAPLYVNQIRELHQPIRYRDSKPYEYLCPDCDTWHPWKWRNYHAASAACLCPDCAELVERAPADAALVAAG